MMKVKPWMSLNQDGNIKPLRYTRDARIAIWQNDDLITLVHPRNDGRSSLLYANRRSQTRQKDAAWLLPAEQGSCSQVVKRCHGAVVKPGKHVTLS